jgi:hypothetical protein
MSAERLMRPARTQTPTQRLDATIAALAPGRYSDETCPCGQPALVLILDDHGHPIERHCAIHVKIDHDLSADCWVLRLA